MLALKNSGIDLSKSETRTIIGFSLIYSILVLVILGVITFLYYQFKKDLMLQDKRQTLQNYSNDQISSLKELHINIDKSNIYPRDDKFNSAIFDSSIKLIFSTLLTKGKLREARRLHSITLISLSFARYWILNGPEIFNSLAI